MSELREALAQMLWETWAESTSNPNTWPPNQPYLSAWLEQAEVVIRWGEKLRMTYVRQCGDTEGNCDEYCGSRLRDIPLPMPERKA